MKARDLMTASDLAACAETTTSQQAAQQLADNNIGALPVLDKEGRLEGIVTDRDICTRLVARGLPFDTPVRDIMSQSVQVIYPDTELKEIEWTMREYKVRRLPVVDKDNKLQGFVSQADLFRHIHGRREEHELITVLESISAPD